MIRTSFIYLIFLFVACSQRTAKESNTNPLTTNSNLQTMNSNLEYASGICAPKLYPVRVHRGDFYTKDDWLPMPNGGIVEEIGRAHV